MSIIRPASLVRILNRSSQAAPVAPSSPDQVSIGVPTHDVLWKAGAKAGLLTAAIGTHGAISGPMGQLLSQKAQAELGAVFSELADHGVQFSYENWTGGPSHREPITPERAATVMLERDMKYIPAIYVQTRDGDPRPIQTLGDVRSLHAIEARQDVKGLDKPELAQAIQDLETAGIRCLVPEDSIHTIRRYDENADAKRLGVSGAYQALEEDRRTGPSMGWNFWMAKVGGDADDGKSEDDVLRTAFFKAGSHVPSLETKPNAVLARDLTAKGLQFFDGEDKRLEPRAVFERLEQDPRTFIKVGMGHLPIDTLGGGVVDDLTGDALAAGKFSPRLQEAMDFYQRRLVPKVAAGELSEEEAGLIARGCSHPIDSLDIDTRYARLQELVDLERGEKEPISLAVGGLEFLLKQRRTGESFGALVAGFRELREQLTRGNAVQCFNHLRNKVQPAAFNEDDYETERTRLVELARIATQDNFDTVLKARDAISIELPGESYGVRLDALKRLDACAAKTPDTDRWKGPLSTAIKAYDVLLRSRNDGESLPQAAQTLTSLAAALVPQEGWESTLQTFTWLQHGLRCGAFRAETPGPAVEALVHSYLLKPDLNGAKEALKAPPPGAKGGIDDDSDTLSIGGLSILR